MTNPKTRIKPKNDSKMNVQATENLGKTISAIPLPFYFAMTPKMQMSGEYSLQSMKRENKMVMSFEV